MMELFWEQVDMFPLDPVIVGDLAKRDFYDPEWDIVLSVENSTHYWNIFDDINGDRDYDVIAQSLTADICGKPFFQQGAEQVMKSLLIHIDKPLESPETRDLVEYAWSAQRERNPHRRIADELMSSPDPRVRDGSASIPTPARQESIYSRLSSRTSAISLLVNSIHRDESICTIPVDMF